jgi:hypothetical protein
MEKQYCEGKEIIRACANCKEWLGEGQELLQDELEAIDREYKVLANIAVISHSICSSCERLLYPDFCFDDNLTHLK